MRGVRDPQPTNDTAAPMTSRRHLPAYWGLRASRRVGMALPNWMSSRLATAVGLAAYWSLPAKRRNMKHNYRVILSGTREDITVSDRQVARLARRSMVAYVRTLVDYFRLPRLLPDVFRDTAYTEGWQHLDSLLAQKRGVLFATLHFGHWDLAAAALARHCPPGTVHAVAESFSNPRIDALVTAEREAYGLHAVPMDDVRRMVRVLREGNLLGLLIDRPVSGDDGVNVRFFGKETRIPSGVATLALLTRCPILPGFLVQDRAGRFHGRILPPIEPSRTGDRKADIQVTMQRVVDALETVVSVSPHRWYMFRAMWPLPAEAAFAPQPRSAAHAASAVARGTRRES